MATNLTFEGVQNAPQYIGNVPNINLGDQYKPYEFGKKLSQLNIASDPFFRFVSKLRKEPVAATEYVYTEERPSFCRRYAYAVGWKHGDDTSFVVTSKTFDCSENIVEGDAISLKLAGDYKTVGNITNVYGQATNKISIGADGTTPRWVIPNILLRVPLKPEAKNLPTDPYSATVATDYMTVLVQSVGGTAPYVEVTGIVVRVPKNGTYVLTTLLTPTVDGEVTTQNVISETYGLHPAMLEALRTTVQGTAFGAGTGVPETWADTPYINGYAMTQILKTFCAMDNSSRANEMRFFKNEYARIWGNKLIEHKWDLEQIGLFSSLGRDANGNRHTEGALNYIMKNSNVFSLNYATTYADDLFEHLSIMLDPRYNSVVPTLFFVSTLTYNWMNRLAGLYKNNITIAGNNIVTPDFALANRTQILGVPTDVFATPKGRIKVIINPHLDGTPVKMLGINLNGVKYRPLIGNGINRDTKVYPGVKSLEKDGTDIQGDLILTEASFEWSLRETHAVWI